jgi:hypothetical protein
MKVTKKTKKLTLSKGQKTLDILHTDLWVEFVSEIKIPLPIIILMLEYECDDQPLRYQLLAFRDHCKIFKNIRAFEHVYPYPNNIFGPAINFWEQLSDEQVREVAKVTFLALRPESAEEIKSTREMEHRDTGPANELPSVNGVSVQALTTMAKEKEQKPSQNYYYAHHEQSRSYQKNRKQTLFTVTSTIGIDSLVGYLGYSIIPMMIAGVASTVYTVGLIFVVVIAVALTYYTVTRLWGNYKREKAYNELFEDANAVKQEVDYLLYLRSINSPKTKADEAKEEKAEKEKKADDRLPGGLTIDKDHYFEPEETRESKGEHIVSINNGNIQAGQNQEEKFISTSTKPLSADFAPTKTKSKREEVAHSRVSLWNSLLNQGQENPSLSAPLLGSPP